MGRLHRFDIVLNNPEETYFAGQEISGKVVLELLEPKKVNEILLELKGRARTYWTQHSGKSRKHVSHSEPYFLEQFNTAYTHKFSVTKNDNEKERVLPAGLHEVPFSYTLPKTLPTSFEGEFGYIRYTCKAICERPWDFDIVTRKGFTVIGIEDINSDPRLNEPISRNETNRTVAWCCHATGSITGELNLEKTGFTAGETIDITYRVTNECSRAKSVCLKLMQNTVYKAKTFAGHEQVKTTNQIVLRNEKPEIPANSVSNLLADRMVVPSLPPRLGKCKIISINYTIDLEVDQNKLVSCDIVIGTIPLLSELLIHTKARNGKDSLNSKKDLSTVENCVQLTITDESGETIFGEQLSSEMDALMSSRKRVRMPSSILSELYPTMPSPYYRESFYGPVDISDEKESAQYGEKMFTPKYPFYTE
ncbi:Arrestin domain-containing protein 17 [Parelaphostrongylus tenuis]|uniref:Arrestin domain-containing protein 17 n=1 Tax=Parelaphostrongylus tenuis TaxID=148309 RepID=A0AAD5WLJ4_PARTN|nr:Arrestin domain-containing protein 17 [Parelaphostrongylus tenuis]